MPRWREKMEKEANLEMFGPSFGLLAAVTGTVWSGTCAKQPNWIEIRKAYLVKMTIVGVQSSNCANQCDACYSRAVLLDSLEVAS
jgi:hypothetical protein